jgi:hypothetical protein
VHLEKTKVHAERMEDLSRSRYFLFDIRRTLVDLVY